jgi:hypothetical protein
VFKTNGEPAKISSAKFLLRPDSYGGLIISGEVRSKIIMKKTILLFAVIFCALICAACVTRVSNKNDLERDREAALEAAARMDRAQDI